MSDTEPFSLDLGVLRTTRHLCPTQRPAQVLADPKLPIWEVSEVDIFSLADGP
jgi:hypothetical protein